MLYGSYKILATLLDDAVLPPYKGSTFRGAFGGCLKKAVCAVRQKDCQDCLLASRCIYAQLFEAKTWSGSDNTRSAAPPHPYLIEPPETSRTRFTAGDAFDFYLILFGEMNSALPYFVYAFELMGEQGIGKKTGDHRARFALKEVSCSGRQLYDPAAGKLLPAPQPETVILTPTQPSDEQLTVEISLCTPLRFKQDNHLLATLQFPMLIRAMLRRVSGLFNAWGTGEPPLDYRGMVARAEQVRVVDGRLYWHEWERYSNRQDTAMNFGGMLGTVVYQGALTEYLPLMRLCQRLHVGKQTTFGLGRFRLVER